MFFKKIDLISPPITIFYKGESAHTSIFSGILSLIVYSISTAFGIYYAVNYIKHANPQVYYYNRYVEDAGIFPMNSSSIFNFIQIIDTVSNIPTPVDFDSIRIIGIEETIDIYENNNNLLEYNHWIYGKCNNSTDTEGINDLIDFQYFTESACIRKYYNKDTKKYYDTNDQNFIWPILKYGCSHPNRTFYGIILEKCRNDSLKVMSDGRKCKSKEEIEEYIYKNSMNLKIIDNYADVVNYENPFIKYFYSVSNGLFENTFTTNHLNLNPATLITNDDLFFENSKEIGSYFFEQNEKIYKSTKSGIYVAFYFWMQNRMQYYERKYSKLQDALSDIGGLASILLTIAYFINYLVSNFVILFDIEALLDEIQSSKKYDKNILRNDIYKNLKERKSISVSLDYCPPIRKAKKNNTSTNTEISNNRLIRSLRINESTKQVISNNKNEEIENNNINIYNIDDNNLSEKNNKENVMKFSSDNSRNKIDRSKDDRSKDDLSKDQISVGIDRNKNKNLKKRSIKFYEYILHEISCERYRPVITEYEDFRCRIISEENLILNYLSVCKLLKAMKRLMYNKANEAIINLDKLRNQL